ncbi:MAG TPA: RecQ family ATP-dependent DNA helicase [Vicinamibacteria bacterium]|nr:RecQ family ATP-dependent DNA helicase [Vicinamibacteria bacterium]
MRPVPRLDLDHGLARLGYPAFRPGQREAIETLLDRGRLLLVAPTGGGKSLTYQLPASLLPGTSLVLSPLVSLMHDQVQALCARGVAATFLAATLSADEMRDRLAGLRAGRYVLAYVAPERLAYPGFRALVSQLEVPLVAVDEAHCISEWGHDFRPDYLQIGGFLEQLRPPRVLACTATATPVVRDEILARLGLPADTPQLLRGFARPNLALRARQVLSRAQRDRQVDGLLAEALGQPGAARGAAIVYAPTRRATEEEAARLAAAGWRAGAYHAGLSGEERTRVQRAFTERSLEVVVATNAFGMGIDRADVRAVVHLGPPGSIEAYYQEVGRAGRDGQEAFGLLLHAPGDLALRKRLLESGSDGTPAAPEVVEHKWALFLDLMRWAEGGSCRHDAILRYFGDEAETLAGCGRCDVCRQIGGEAQDDAAATVMVRKALSAVARVDRRYGLTAAVKLLAGIPDPRLLRAGLDRSPTFGVLRGHAEPWLTQLLRRCVTAGWVDLTPGDRPLVVLTAAGRAVMKGERPARLVLPQAASAEAADSRKAGGAGGPRRAAASEGALSGPDAEVFEALRRARQELARQQKVPAFVVASDRTLREIALLKPRTAEDLQLASGIGPVKAEQYGRRLLEAVAEALDRLGGDPAIEVLTS